ncbi:MAG: lipid-A-disaccharide synthase [Bacteroidetes bacterium]|nr:lipid-A-disaccharide synthase [Bacteroidota bacterium]
MKYYIIAGEASGDLHGSNLIKALHTLDANANIRCWGGDKMQAAGATVVKHYRDLAFMGFTEVVKNLPTILKNISHCKKDILAYKPDVLLLIDYPGFNLRIAKWAKQEQLKIVYYISPQVWAWKENRVKSIKECVDKMLVILPFEKEFYKKWNYPVEYVGHPLVEVVEDFKKSNTALDIAHNGRKIIALLPGSRKQEILKKLPIMLEVSKHYPQYQFIVAKAPGLDEDFYNHMLSGYENVSSVVHQTYALLSASSAALVTSGTATLETALFAVPEIICYKGNAISYAIAKRLIKIKFIGLVNLIMNKEVVKELIQHELTVENIKKELDQLLNDAARKEQLQNDYTALKEILSKGGHASSNAARIIYEWIK